MKVIVDENLPPEWCGFLQQYGHSAIHWKDLGQHGDADELIFDYAQAERSVILTQDLDFTRIFALRGSSASQFGSIARGLSDSFIHG